MRLFINKWQGCSRLSLVTAAPQSLCAGWTFTPLVVHRLKQISLCKEILALLFCQPCYRKQKSKNTKVLVKYIQKYNTQTIQRVWREKSWCWRADQPACDSREMLVCAWWVVVVLPALNMSGLWPLSPQDIADPFFAYCKQHADRFDRKWKRKNYLALQSYCKVSLQERERQLPPEAQVRLQRSFWPHRGSTPWWIPVRRLELKFCRLS